MPKHRTRLILAGAVLAAWAALAGAQTIQKASVADNPKSYRVDAAQHIYARYASRIFKGKLPQLMHAIVVTKTQVAADGTVLGIRLVRTPSHAPDVAIAVMDMIRAASPLPAPTRLGGTKFLEVWLVDKSGRFQLDTLTEGQL